MSGNPRTGVSESQLRLATRGCRRCWSHSPMASDQFRLIASPSMITLRDVEVTLIDRVPARAVLKAVT